MRRSEIDEARPPVSCCICPIDEETRIEATVQAALRVAREVVVVDSGSTDRTVVMARAAGARVIERKRSDLGDRTRAGEDACRRDWLLYLDSGEIVTEELAREMHDLFRAGEPSADAGGSATQTIEGSRHESHTRIACAPELSHRPER